MAGPSDRLAAFLGRSPGIAPTVGHPEDAGEVMRRLADLAGPKLGP